MRTWPCAFLIAVSGLFAGPVLAAGQTDGNDCTQAVDVMAACTRVIQNAGASNAIRAKAFTGRGNVHFEKKRI
jgi:hypothetical protein